MFLELIGLVELVELIGFLVFFGIPVSVFVLKQIRYKTTIQF